MGSYYQSFKYQKKTKEKKLECTQKKWCYRFLVRNYLKFRAGIQIRQEHPEN